MAELLLCIFILFYLVIGMALSIDTDYPALVTVFWFPLFIIRVVMDAKEFLNDIFEYVKEWLEDKTKKMGE